jgi:hypothetical protein
MTQTILAECIAPTCQPTALRTQQQEETLAMYGASKIWTNPCGVSVGTIDGVEVLLGEHSPVLHRIDLETTEGNIYGFNGRPQDLEQFAPLNTWTRFIDYVLFTRVRWSSRFGNYLRANVSDVQWERS